ncbi:extracellular solute-binding protein [Candidatus Sumerlaeota bacterium]|nr:extracellular solute-binding protein [Candidatus Sumerlaeota bacterium]
MDSKKQKSGYFSDIFPFGVAPFIIFVLTVISFLWLAIHPVARKKSSLSLWTFADLHYKAYKKLLPSFEESHPGTKLDLQIVHISAVTSRLRSALWAGIDVPDMVEVEISVAGSFFCGPIEDIGLRDLSPWLKSSGLYDRMVETRFAPYTNRGKIFGLPHDVHPVMLAYRRDIFEKQGIDLSQVKTWDEFVEIGKRVTIPGERYMIQFSQSNRAHIEVLLFQRGGGYFDKDGNVILDNDLAVETMKWYIPLVTGTERIGNDIGGGVVFTKSLEDGYILSFLCPDWMTKSVETDVPRVAGKMALMPLPSFESGGRHTSTMGGTMLGITENCKNIELAREFVEVIYLNRDDLADRFRETNIIPPLREAWDHAVFSEKRPYWSDQPIGKLYIDLADDVPPQYTSPYVGIAKAKLGEALSSCHAYYSKNGENGFDDFVRKRLKKAADDIRRIQRRNPF